MAFTQFSQPVQRPDIYKPLPDELILAGAKANYEHGEQQAKKLGSTYNSLFGISTYGKDAETLSQFQQDFQQQVGELAKQGLNTPEAQSKINQLINAYSTNPDVMAIHQRVAFKNSEEEKMAKAQEKGETYSSRNYQKLMNYYNGDKYYTKPQDFNLSQGYVNPQISKLQNDLIKNNEKSIYRKVTSTTPEGYIITQNKVDGDKAAQLWQQQVENDPSLKRYYFDQFEDQNQGVDWDADGSNLLYNAHLNSLQLAQLHPEQADYYNTKAEQQLRASQSGKTGNELKYSAFNDYIAQDAHDFGNVKNALDVEDIKTDAFKLDQARTANDRYLYGEKLRMDAGYYEDKGIPAKQESKDKTVYSNTGEPTSSGALYNNLQSAFKGDEVGLNYLAPKIAKSQNIDYDPETMRLHKNEDGTVTLQESSKKDETNWRGKVIKTTTEWTDIPNTKSDLNSAISLFSGADKKSYDQFVNHINKENTVNTPKEGDKKKFTEGNATFKNGKWELDK